MEEQKCILYIEDEEDLVAEVSAELREYGIKVVNSSEYIDAIVKASNQKFDMFIVDIHLKKGTGDQIIKSIKSNPRHINHRTPMLVASSQITTELVETIGKDIQYALVKPFDFKQFLENIFKALDISPYDHSE